MQNTYYVTATLEELGMCQQHNRAGNKTMNTNSCWCEGFAVNSSSNALNSLMEPICAIVDPGSCTSADVHEGCCVCPSAKTEHVSGILI